MTVREWAVGCRGGGLRTVHGHRVLAELGEPVVVDYIRLNLDAVAWGHDSNFEELTMVSTSL
jgi:hypothetical protein